MCTTREYQICIAPGRNPEEFPRTFGSLFSPAISLKLMPFPLLSVEPLHYISKVCPFLSPFTFRISSVKSTPFSVMLRFSFSDTPEF